MLINWFTVLAQIVNFLILIYLLNRFLFKPILRAIAEREKKMAEALNRAEQAEQDAEEKVKALAAEKAAFEGERDALMVQAQKQVGQWREDTLEAAQKELDALQDVWVTNMNRDREAFLEGLKQRMVELVVHMGEKVFRDLAGEGLNRQVVRIFLEKVAERHEAVKQFPVKGSIVVQTGVPFEKDDAKTLREGLRKRFSGETEIKIESAPEIGFGIQLLAGDQKTAWHLTDYLRDLEAEIMENLFKDARVKL